MNLKFWVIIWALFLVLGLTLIFLSEDPGLRFIGNMVIGAHLAMGISIIVKTWASR